MDKLTKEKIKELSTYFGINFKIDFSRLGEKRGYTSYVFSEDSTSYIYKEDNFYNFQLDVKGVSFIFNSSSLDIKDILLKMEEVVQKAFKKALKEKEQKDAFIESVWRKVNES